MPWKIKRRYGLKYWGMVLVLCVVAAVSALALSRFFESFYSYVPQFYEPKDTSRGGQTEDGKKSQQADQ
jgi:hypothetical protein